MYKVEYLPAALKDLTEIARYIAQELHNKKAALEITAAIVAMADGLAAFPYKNKVYLPLRPLKYEYRSLPVKNYLVFYRVDEEAKLVTVARVIYARRDIGKIIK